MGRRPRVHSDPREQQFKFLTKWYLKRTHTLRISNTATHPGLSYINDFLETNGIKTVVVEGETLSGYLTILKELKDYEKLEHLALSVPGTPDLPLAQAIADTVSCNKNLVSFKLRWNAQNEFIVSVLQALPSSLLILNLSDNAFTCPNEVLLEALSPLLRQLLDLDLRDTAFPTRFADAFYECIMDQGPHLTLETLRGINFRRVESCPDSIKRLPAASSSEQALLNYLKDRVFGKLLTGARVRVWWPPTVTAERRDYAGRFWPATIQHIQPDLASVVIVYDNDQSDQVKTNVIQPLSCFSYGEVLTTDEEEAAEQQPQPQQTSSSSSDPSRGQHRGQRQQMGPTQPTLPPVLPGMDQDVLQFEHQILGLPRRSVGRIMWPNEWCEFREASFIPVRDVSDFVGVIHSVTADDQEPAYTVRYVFHDANNADPNGSSSQASEPANTVEVASVDIRRAVYFSWEHWRGAALDRLRKLLPWEMFERENKSLLEQGMRRSKIWNLWLPKKATADLTQPPLNIQYYKPMETTRRGERFVSPMKVAKLTPQAFAKWFRRSDHPLQDHPLIKGLGDPTQSVRELTRRINILRDYLDDTRALRSVMDNLKNDVGDTCVVQRHRFSVQLLVVRNAIVCSVCMERPLETIVDPCHHLAACKRCLENVNECPLCREKISQKIAISTQFSEAVTMLDKIIHESEHLRPRGPSGSSGTRGNQGQSNNNNNGTLALASSTGEGHAREEEEEEEEEEEQPEEQEPQQQPSSPSPASSDQPRRPKRRRH